MGYPLLVLLATGVGIEPTGALIQSQSCAPAHPALFVLGLDLLYIYHMSKYIYLAGLLDGEGTVGISKNSSKYRTPYISVTSTTYEIVKWLEDNFGGHIAKQKVYQDHHKQSWCWKLVNRQQVDDLLINTLPYMLEPDKIRRGHMILDEYSKVTNRNGKYTPEQLAAKIDFENRFLQLC